MKIRIWEHSPMVFIDLTNGNDSYEVKRFNMRDLGSRLQEHVAYHVNRLHQVTGADWINETKLDL